MYKLTKEEIENAPVFMPVVGYEGLYEVGKDGSVWSLNYKRTGERKRLRPAPSSQFGYLGVGLCKDGKAKTRRVHQLILEAYLPKPAEDLDVLHLDSELANNQLSNLAWGTHKENANDPHRKTLIINHPDKSIPVLCVETGVVYPSANEASRQTGIWQGNISKCCNGKLESAGGFRWQKVKES